MTKQIDEAKNKFHEELQKFKELSNFDMNLIKRSDEAKDNIVNLEDEKEKLRQERPALLADNKDVSKINKRLKKIDEEIELNQDTITGIEAKRKDIHNPIIYARQDVNSAYKTYINEILANLRKKYMKVASPLAELLKDYIALETLRDGSQYNHTDFKIDYINELPNFDGEAPLFKYNYYGIGIDNRDRVKEKYDIPEYTTKEIKLTDFI